MAKSLIAMLVAALPPGRKKRRVRRLKAIRPSHAVELQYLHGLASIVEECKAAGETIANGLRPHWPSVHDETAPGAGPLIERAAQHLTNMVSSRADLLARIVARRALTGVDDALVKAIHRALGVDISGYLGADTEIGAAMKTAVANNVALIKSIPEEYLGKVSAKVQSYFAAGKRWESLAEEIERLGDVTYTRARIIARDQASKLNAAFNEVRQTSVGIEEYDWSGVRDQRERKSHLAMEGTRQRWDSPPLVDGEHVHPGEAVLCRCGAIPRINLNIESSPGAAQAEERQAA